MKIMLMLFLDFLMMMMMKMMTTMMMLMMMMMMKMMVMRMMDGWREGGRDGGMMLMMMGLKVHDGCDDVVADDGSTPSCWRRSVCRCDVQPSCKEEPHGKTHLQSRAPQASEARRPCWNQFPKFECIHAPATPKPDSQTPCSFDPKTRSRKS